MKNPTRNILLSFILVLGCNLSQLEIPAWSCGGTEGIGGSCGPINGLRLNADSPWEEIFRASNLQADFGDLQFSNVLVRLDGVCLDSDGETLSGGTIEDCVEWNETHKVCLKQQKFDLKLSVHQIEQVCADKVAAHGNPQCSKYEPQLNVVPLSYNITVNELMQSKQGIHPVPLFKKPWKVPPCPQN